MQAKNLASGFIAIAMKRNHLQLAIVATLVLAIAVYFGFRSPQKENHDLANSSEHNQSSSSMLEDKPEEKTSALVSRKTSSEKSLAKWKERFFEIQADQSMNDDDREMALREVMEKISSKMEILECLAFVSQYVGKGNFRDSLSLQIFGHSKSDTRALLAAIAERKGKQQKIHCYTGMFDRMYLRQMADDEKLAILEHAVEQKSMDAITFYAMLQIAARNDGESPREAMARIRAFTDKLGPEAQAAISEGIARGSVLDDPFLAWELKPKDHHTKERLFDYMMRKDKKRTLEMVLHDEALSDRLQQGVTHYLNSDSTAANQWIEEHFDRLDQPKKNQVLAAQYLHHLNDLGDDEHSKLNELRELSDQITDLSIRKKVRDDIWLKEREMVRTTVDSEPQKAIEELVAGKSPYDAYWIEEAMDVWMEKDSKQAEQWYQDNWKTLPQDKAQYAAASFAKQAITAGDLDAATQWIPFIQDPKTKERIEGELKNALEK